MIRAMRRTAWTLIMLLPLLVSGCAASWIDETGGSPHEMSLDTWVRTELVPYLSETLSEHPRFKGEAVLVVSMDGDRRRTDSDRLSGMLVESITDALLDAGGVNLVWERDTSSSPCAPQPATQYFVGVDVAALTGGDHRVSVRALDIEEKRWVSGFGRQWQGRLNRAERSGFEKREARKAAPGMRDTPFAESQPDLLAKHLADALARQYCGHVGAPLRIMPSVDGDAPPVVARTVALVGNYLAGSRHLDIVEQPDRANVTLSGKLVPIDEDLHQLWLQLRPANSGDGVRPMDLQAYVRLVTNAATRQAAKARRDPAPPQFAAASLSTVRVITPSDRRRCASADPWRRGARTAGGTHSVMVDACFALEIESRRDAHVFLLAHDRNAQLVRLLPNSCDRYGRVSSFVKQGTTLRFPSRQEGRRHVFSAGAADDFDVFYVVTVADRAAARAVLGRVLDTADVCGRPGSERPAANRLARLEQLVNDLGPEGSWHRVRVLPDRPST